MKKYDVRYTDCFYGYNYGNRYVERVEANNEEEASKIILEKYKDKRIKQVRVYDAVDYIAYTYSPIKNGNTTSFEKSYYGGFLDLPLGCKAQMLVSHQEEAKKFQLLQELKDEIKSIGRKVGDYKYEKVSVN